MIDISNRNTIDIRDKNITVIGLGLSGTASAKLANHLGACVFASDSSDNYHICDNAMILLEHYIASETGLHSDKIYDSDLWIISPGIPKNSLIVQNAQEIGIPIVSEIEFASWFTNSPIIAVTGSNGKTTTVNILSKMCQSDRINTLIAGNIGIPFSSRVLDELTNPKKNSTYILEISSFQMEFVKHFHPKIAVYTNLSADHLDRHGTMDKYINMKLEMIKNMGSDDHIVYNADDPQLNVLLKDTNAKLKPFSISQSGMTYSLDSEYINSVDGEKIIALEEIALPGQHNLLNLLAAATSSQIMGILDQQIADVMKNFTSIEHRLEKVATIDGIIYINDSKATNLESVNVAIDSFDIPIILILGGRNKGADFRLLLPHIKSSHVRGIVSYGEAGEHILTAIGDAVRSVQVTDLNSAVEKARTLATPGDVVLLSPGCASFDEFSNFEERGEYFKSRVLRLKDL